MTTAERCAILLLVLAAGCSRDLGLDGERFRCESDDDCIRGTVCAPGEQLCRPRDQIADGGDAGVAVHPDATAAPGPDATAPDLPDASVPDVGPPIDVRWGTETSTHVEWWWYRGLSAAEVDERIAFHDARIADIEIEQTEPAWRFTVVLVDNSGAQHVDAIWTGPVPRSELTLGGRRMIDVELAVTGTVVQFVAVGVDNSGARHRGWWWYWDTTLAFVDQRKVELDAEYVDVNRYQDNGVRVGAVLVARSSSTSASFAAQTPADLATLVGQGWGLTALEVEGDGRRFTVGTASCPCARSRWVYDLDADALSAAAAASSMRIAKLVRYVRAGEVLFAAILVDDSG